MVAVQCAARTLMKTALVSYFFFRNRTTGESGHTVWIRHLDKEFFYIFIVLTDGYSGTRLLQSNRLFRRVVCAWCY